MAHLLRNVLVFSVNFFSSAQYVQNAILERIIYTRIKIITRRMRARYRPICGLKVNQTHTRCSDFSFVDIAIHNSIASSLQKSYAAFSWRRQRRRRWKYKHEHKATCSDMANINTQQTCRKWTRKKTVELTLRSIVKFLSAIRLKRERERDWLEEKRWIFRDFMTTLWAVCLLSFLSSRATPNCIMFNVHM